MNKDVIVALDFDDINKLEIFLKKFDKPIYVKVGMELFYAYGPNIIELIKKYNHKVFLDLKLHDIPNTVKSAMKVINKLDVDMVNVHALGGLKMMKEARETLDNSIKLIAVTHLTSTKNENLKDDLSIDDDLENAILKLAVNAKKANLDGVVCSALESKIIKNQCGENFLTICPGIRRKIDNPNDQIRIVTPQEAHEIGCDYIVVGRPITQSDNNKIVYNEFKNKFLGDLI